MTLLIERAKIYLKKAFKLNSALGTHTTRQQEQLQGSQIKYLKVKSRIVKINIYTIKVFRVSLKQRCFIWRGSIKRAYLVVQPQQLHINSAIQRMSASSSSRSSANYGTEYGSRHGSALSVWINDANIRPDQYSIGLVPYLFITTLERQDAHLLIGFSLSYC